jgi:hypothetical protein
MDVTAKSQKRLSLVDRRANRVAPLMRSIPLKVRTSVGWGVGDQYSVLWTIAEDALRLVLGECRIPRLGVSGGDFSADTEEGETVKLNHIAVEEVSGIPIPAESLKFIRPVMIAKNKNHGDVSASQDFERFPCSFAASREIAGTDNDIRLHACPDNSFRGLTVAMQVAECQYPHAIAHDFENRSSAAPSRVTKVESTFARSSFSFKNHTPMISAKTTLVSRRAVTRGIGAWVNAQTTRA